jgi:polysaccharide pyruvyl transferase WcaK-like protein
MASSLRLGVSHWYSADNLGDLAILTGQLRLLDSVGVKPCVLIGVEPGVAPMRGVDMNEFTCSPWPSPFTGGLGGWIRGLVGAMVTLVAPRSRGVPKRFREFSKLIDGLDVLMPKGGGYLYSRSGAPGLLFTLRICWPLLLARRVGTLRLVLGQSIGPADTRIGALILRMALRGAHVVVRDEASASLLTRWALPHERAPDFAFTWAGTVDRRRERGSKEDITTIGLTALTIGEPPQQTVYEEALVAALNDLLASVRANGREVRLLLYPQVVGPHPREDDRPVLLRIAEQVDGGGGVVELRHDDVATALGTYRALDFLVASRLHSAILASCVCVPFVVFEYIGGKARGAVRDLGLPAWVVVDHVDDLGRVLKRGWSERNALAAISERRLPGIAAEIASATAAVFPVSSSVSVGRRYSRNRSSQIA